jgi:Tetratricopeptide repeat
MNRLPAGYCIAGLLTLLIVCPAWGQNSGSGSSGSKPSAPSGSGSSGSGNSSGQRTSPGQSTGQLQTPLYVNGRVLLDTGQPVQEPVSVGLTCGMRSMQTIHTDSKGYFQFTLGAGPQGNMDLGAADQGPMSSGIGMNFPNGGGSFGSSGGFNALTGCELRVSVAGYIPLTSTITEPGEMNTIEVGTLQLRRIAGATGSSISVTSMLVPKEAKKEFDKGTEDLHNKKLPSATEHLEKAVADYDKYAAAWSELGSIYSSGNQTEKAHQAFEKAIAADPHYIPPYISLAVLSIQTQDYEGAIDMAGKALELDPTLGVALYIQALGNFKLDRMPAAEKSGLEAEKGPHQSFPQLHAMMAEIYMLKQDDAHAAAEMRAYLKEAPNGPFAADTKKNLEQIAPASSEGGSASAQPQIAP